MAAEIARLSVLSLGFLYRKNRAATPEGEGMYQTKGGPKPVFGRGVLREVVLPPLFCPPPPPPWRLLIISLRLNFCVDGKLFTLAAA